MIRQKDYQWEAAIKVAKEDGADYVAILLGRLRDAQKEIEALEAAQHSVQRTCFNCGGPVNVSTGFVICERGCGGPVTSR